MPPGEGTSSGNAGIISVGSVHPEAMPGIWKEIPHMLIAAPMAPISFAAGLCSSKIAALVCALSGQQFGGQGRSVLGRLSAPCPASARWTSLQPLVFRRPALTALLRAGRLDSMSLRPPAQFAAAKRELQPTTTAGAWTISLSRVAQSSPISSPACARVLAGAVLVPCWRQSDVCRPWPCPGVCLSLFQQQGGGVYNRPR